VPLLLKLCDSLDANFLNKILLMFEYWEDNPTIILAILQHPSFDLEASFAVESPYISKDGNVLNIPRVILDWAAKKNYIDIILFFCFNENLHDDYKINAIEETHRSGHTKALVGALIEKYWQLYRLLLMANLNPESPILMLDMDCVKTISL